MLVNAPLVDQLNEPTADHLPDENRAANCVPASLASGLMALLPGQTFDGDELKDAVYGQGYTGATDPARFVAECAGVGVALEETPSSDASNLLRIAVAALDRHQPATGAIPSQWGSVTGADINAHGGPTHEVTFCDHDGTNLTAMNPWPVDGAHAFYQVMPFDWWASRLCYERIFTMRRRAVTYQQHADGSLTYPNGVTLTHALAAYVVGQQLGATPFFAETYFVPTHSCTPFDDGTVLSWDVAQQRVRTDLAGACIKELADGLAQAHLTQNGGDDAADDAAIATAVAALQHAEAGEPASGGGALSGTASFTTNSGSASSGLPATYAVSFGDTLERLAAVFYGDASRAADILVANGLINGDLSVGQQLVIPAPQTPDDPDAVADAPILARTDGE